MLYKKNTAPSLDPELFRNLTSEYRGAPFWSWNTKLEKEELMRQIGCLKEMGMGGFHMHSRTGLATEYLSDEFMDLVKACTDRAEQEGMLAWLYDEDRWPSGFAGGLVTKNEEYRARYLCFTPRLNKEVEQGSANIAASVAARANNGRMLACYDIELDSEGTLASYRRISPEEEARGRKWYAYLEVSLPSKWFNNQTYVNTLDKKAIDEFIRCTYERYKEAVGDRFSQVIPAIFTDEPQFTRKTALGFAEDQTDVMLPWSDDLTETFRAAYQSDLLEQLPELIWDLPDGQVSLLRYRYHDHISERFAEAFADNCGRWCEENGLLLTGHMMEEPTLKSQTAALGDAMRSYRAFGLPGIDMLCNAVELTTAKQAQSAVRQYGREGMLSELYGVTGWHFDFRGHKFQGDWQAALGVTVRVHHLSWVSMAGEAKRDYPASMNYQVPWYPEYPAVENHFARLNTALTRGKPIVRIGVIHPVESYWLYWGPQDSSHRLREQLDENFERLTEWLLFGQQDFDFICESLLSEQCPVGGFPLSVGRMDYDILIVPGCHTLRRTTFERLRAFQEGGGRLIFLGGCPGYLDAQPSQELRGLYEKSLCLPFEKEPLLSALADDAEIRILDSDGFPAENLIYQYRQDQECRWLFLAHAKKEASYDVARRQELKIGVQGEYTPSVYDTLTGEIHPISYRVRNGRTEIQAALYQLDSLLLCLSAYNGSEVLPQPEPKPARVFSLRHKVECRRMEPNVCLLDLARFRLDDGEFSGLEEILRIDNLCREQLGYPCRTDAIPQPWTVRKKPIEHWVTLEYTLYSEMELAGALLALEDAADAKIILNGQAVPVEINGYFVDKVIQTVPLPPLAKGENNIQVTLPFAEHRDLESVYLLGEFDVRLEGVEQTLMPCRDWLGFGSVVPQGRPFYSGNLEYRFEIELESCGSLEIRVSRYAGAAVAVEVDGIRRGLIIIPPYTCRAEGLSQGKHEILLRVLGTRHNTFGALHCCDPTLTWNGPGAWRTTGDSFCYEYNTRDYGILKSPEMAFFPEE